MEVRNSERKLKRGKSFKGVAVEIVIPLFIISIIVGYLHSLVVTNNGSMKYYKNFLGYSIENELAGITNLYVAEKQSAGTKLTPLESKDIGFYYEIKADDGKTMVKNHDDIRTLLTKNPLFYYEFHIGENSSELTLINVPGQLKLDNESELPRLQSISSNIADRIKNATVTIAMNKDSVAINSIVYNGRFIEMLLVSEEYKLLSIILFLIVLIVFYIKPYDSGSKILKKYSSIYTEIKFIVVIYYIMNLKVLNTAGSIYYFIGDMIGFPVIENSMVTIIFLISVAFIIPLILSMLIGLDIRFIKENGIKVLWEKSLIFKKTNLVKKKLWKYKKEEVIKEDGFLGEILKSIESKSLETKVKIVIVFFGIYLTIILFLMWQLFGTNDFGIWYFNSYVYELVIIWSLIILCVLFPIILFIVVRRFFLQIDDIKRSTEKIVKGDFNIELKKRYNIILNPISENLSNINVGFKEAIDKEMKGEMLKSELITTVSEDLKVPLNSIIGYVDMLKRPDLSDIERMECLKILEKKSKNIKILIENLFEATKASTGNIKLNIEDVNVVAILKQTLGEFEDGIERSGLTFKVNMPMDKVTLKLDGARTWRIFENLISNALKYSLEGSRVYLNLYNEEDYVIFEMKNVSGYELNCTPSELRNKVKNSNLEEMSEGSGLGLSIANSLVELQGGTMDIDIDGDLFKVIIKFKKQ